jgi:hypothetical protein
MHRGLEPAWGHCERVRASLLAAVEPVPAELWSRRGPASGWTLAQQLDHLLKSEVGTSKIARKLIRGDYRALERPAEARCFDSGLSVYPFPPSEAPAPLVPAASGGKELLLPELARAHQRFQEELSRFEGEDADALQSPDLSGLWFTLGGWVRVQALHEEHHLQQIAQMLKP